MKCPTKSAPLPLPVAGERYKRDGLTREVLAVDTLDSGASYVTFRIRYGEQDETHNVPMASWSRWAEKARKEVK